ncbi:hypothetical protein ACWDNT_29945, partial [Streptomyces sp. NPDC000963]
LVPGDKQSYGVQALMTPAAAKAAGLSTVPLGPDCAAVRDAGCAAVAVVPAARNPAAARSARAP